MCADARDELSASSGDASATASVATPATNARSRHRRVPPRRPRAWIDERGDQREAQRDVDVRRAEVGDQHSDIPIAGAARNSTNRANRPSTMRLVVAMNRWFSSPPVDQLARPQRGDQQHGGACCCAGGDDDTERRRADELELLRAGHLGHEVDEPEVRHPDERAGQQHRPRRRQALHVSTGVRAIVPTPASHITVIAAQ